VQVERCDRFVVYADQTLRPDEERGIVYEARWRDARHAAHDVHAELCGELRPEAARLSRNLFRQFRELLPERIARRGELRQEDKLGPLLRRTPDPVRRPAPVVLDVPLG
jgi:hypothetical protein